MYVYTFAVKKSRKINEIVRRDISCMGVELIHRLPRCIESKSANDGVIRHIHIASSTRLIRAMKVKS